MTALDPSRYLHFLQWARAHCLPIDRPLAALDQPLCALIGNARLISLGEGLHGAREPLEFRNALFAWLVERLGGRAIALESGLSPGLAIDEFVQGAPGDANDVVVQGITSGLHAFPQQASLVRWMRAFNAQHASSGHGLSFHGIDTSPMAGSPSAALDIALGFLDRVDAPAAAMLRGRLGPLSSRLEVDRMAPEACGYTTLHIAQRDAVTASVADMLALIEVHEAAYLMRSSPLDYRRATEAARAARQADLYLRQFAPGWSAAQGFAGIWPSVAVSDRTKAENVEHLLRRQLAPDERMLLFSHVGHASTLPVAIRLGADTVALPPMMGGHLKRRLHEGEMLTIGHLIGNNQCQPEVGQAPADSIEGRLATLGHDALLLDLRLAPPDVRDELQAGPHALHGQLPVHLLSPGLGIDAIYFTQRATPAF